jgi:alkylated DNA repair dioxygenase AlkB
MDCVSYTPGFVAEPDKAFSVLWNELEWERRGSTPRREYYCNEVAVPYAYGTEPFMKSYEPRAWHPAILAIKAAAEAALGTKFEVAFLNGYEDARDHLGAHADDSPEMDPDRPIVIVTLGAEREIWFMTNDDPKTPFKVLLENGSMCVMAAGMQRTHKHRIPKCDRVCGPRLSITLRGYVAPAGV